jgi:hypothetical protein
MTIRNSWARSIEKFATRGVMVALVVVTVLFAIALGIIYLGDEYAHPAWSERSVPPAILY